MLATSQTSQTSHPGGRARWLAALALVAGAAAAIHGRGALVDWMIGEGAAEASGGGARAAFYTCSMDPSVQADHAGTCPICGMALTAVREADRASGAIWLSRETQLRIGLTVAVVQRVPLRRSVDATGAVIDHISGHAGDRTGRTGGRSAGHTSGDLSGRSAGRTFGDLSGRSAGHTFGDLSGRSAGHTFGDLSGRSAGHTFGALSGRSAGHTFGALSGRNAGRNAGRASESGEPAARIPERRGDAGASGGAGAAEALADAPARRAAIRAQIYRGDPSLIAPGAAAVVTAPGLPLDAFPGAIEPALPGDLDGALRVSVDDPAGELPIGAPVAVRVDVALAERLAVPAAAIIYAGARRIAFVDRGGGRFEPREIAIGIESGDLVEVVRGLAAGDSVVVRGTFLLAADSRIRSDGALWSGRVDPPPGKPPRPAGAAGAAGAAAARKAAAAEAGDATANTATANTAAASTAAANPATANPAAASTAAANHAAANHAAANTAAASTAAASTAAGDALAPAPRAAAGSGAP